MPSDARRNQLSGGAAPCALAVALLLAGCAHAKPAATPPRTAAQTAPAPPAAAAPVDWLPADSFVLAHVDVDQLRALLPLALLADKLRPELQTLLERTHTLVFSLCMRGGGETAALAGAFVGDYDAVISPLLLADTPRVRGSDPQHELWTGGDDVWFRTSEGYWVAGEPSVAPQLLIAPARREQRLSQQPWTAPPSGPYVATVALKMPPGLRAALREQVVHESMIVAEMMPALFELDDLHTTLIPDGDGLRLLADFGFISERGAKSGALVLRGALILLGSRGEPESTLQRALEAVAVTVAGTHVRAEVNLDREQLAAIGELLERLSQEPSTPDKPAAVAAPPYQLPSAELLAQRERDARADRRFARVLDRVLAQAGPDVELREARDAQTGKPGKHFLLVRVAQDGALAQRDQLSEALRADGFMVVPVSRGFEGRPTELGVFQARDQAAVLIARGTGEAHKPGTSKQLATLLRKWQANAGARVAVADVDYVAVELTAVPADPERFVQELIAVCTEANAGQQLKQLRERRMLDCFFE